MNLFDFFKNNNVKLDENLQKEIEDKRKTHKEQLRKRLKDYYLSDEEIDNLFKIFTKAENKIEKIKTSIDYKTAKQRDLLIMYKKISDIQEEMELEFETKLNKLLKKKYETAKKILEIQELNRLNQKSQ